MAEALSFFSLLDARIPSLRCIDPMDRRFGALFITMILYGLQGEPTPDHIGITEIVMGALLVYATGIASFWRTVRFPSGNFEKAGLCLLLYGVSLPVIMALLQGHSLSLVIRDILPFFFLLLPLFLGRLVCEKPVYADLFRFGVVFIALAFSCRLLVPVYLRQSEGLSGWLDILLMDTAYLANAPIVLFTALFLSGTAGRYLYRSLSLSSFAKALVFLCFAALPLLAMALVLQRASFFMMAAGLFFLLGVAFVRSPERTLVPLVLLVGVLFVLWPDLQIVTGRVFEKTAEVGFNMRGEELAVVRDLAGQSLVGSFFGQGWGTTIESPAVAGMTVNYTHSLFTSYWLKTGVAGCVLALLYFFPFFGGLYRIVFRMPIMAVAMAAPFLIDLFLYASFKSFDFGLLLLLIVLWAERTPYLQETPRCSIQR